MRYERAVAEYLTIGLRLGKLMDGFVDCWYGNPELAALVDAAPPPAPGELAAQAARLRSELADAGLAEPRRRYLDAQLAAVACSARRLAGVPVPFLAEVSDCFGVEIAPGAPDSYAQVHDEISGLLRADGDLRGRVEAFYQRNLIPPGKLLRCAEAVSEALRARTRSVFGLPDAEQVSYEVVADRPWNAFNRYLGGFRSSISLNADAGRTIAALPLIVAHEAYPGHHTEHCRKEAGLVNGQGLGEHVISLVNTPQSLLAEGTAEFAITAAVGQGWGAWTQEILAACGVHIEGPLVERMVALIRRLMPARQDAAIMLHDRRASPDEVTSYLQRWLLLPADRARHMVNFLTDPLWRAYSVTYVEGPRLVGEWLAARPAGMPFAERYRRLLDDQLLPAEMAEGA